MYVMQDKVAFTKIKVMFDTILSDASLKLFSRLNLNITGVKYLRSV